MSFYNNYNKTVTVIVLIIVLMNLHVINGNTNGTVNASNLNGYRRSNAAVGGTSNMQTLQSSRERDNKLMSLLAERRTALTSSQPAANTNSSSNSINRRTSNSRWRSRVYNTQNQNLDCAKNCTNNFTVRLSAECIRRCPPMNNNRTNINRDITKESQNVSVSSSVSVSTSSKTSSNSNNNNNNNNGITHHPKIDELNSIRDELLDMDESSHVLVVNSKTNNEKYPTSIVMHGTKDLSNSNNLYEAEDLKTEFKLLPPSDIGGTSQRHLHHPHHHGPSAGVFNRTSKYTNIIRSRHHKTPSTVSTTSERTTLEESDLVPYFYFGQKLTPTSRHPSPLRSSSSSTTEKPSLIGSASNTNNKFWLANRNQPTNNRNINIVAFNNAQRRAQSAIVSPNITPTTLRPYYSSSTTEPISKRSSITPKSTTTSTTTPTPTKTPNPTDVQKLIENITSVKIPHPLEINHNLGLLGADDKNDEKRLEQPGISDIFNITEATTERAPSFRIEVPDATNNTSSEEAIVITEIAPQGMQIVGVENDNDETIVFVNNLTAGTPSTTTSTISIPTTVLTIETTLNSIDELDTIEQRTFAPVPDLNVLFPNIANENQSDSAINTTMVPVAEVRTIISSMSSNSSTVQPMNLTTSTTTTITTQEPTTTSTTTTTTTTTSTSASTRKTPIMKVRPNRTTTTTSTTTTVLPLISTTLLPVLNTSLLLPPFLMLPNKDANFTKPKLSVHILKDNGEPLNDTNDVTVEIHRMNMATYVLAGLGMFPIVVILMYVIKTVVFKKKPKVTEDLDRYIQEGQPISPVVRLEQSDTSSIAGDSIVTDRDFDRNKIRFKSLLGEGNFGQVWKAEVDDLAGHLGTTRIVAVKAERSASRQSGLKQEAEIMRKLGSHTNVVTLLGACIEQEPHLLIMEFAMRGRLLSLLRAARNTVTTISGTINCRNIINPLSPHKLACFSHDIARGMEYIAEKKIVHRDLAARNILLDHNGICKICDFGMSIDLEKSKPTQPQTRKADFINRQNSHHSPESRFRYDLHHSSGPTRFMANVLNFDRCGKSMGIGGNNNNNNNNTMGRVRPALPIRWMAPESLQYHIFSVESDVWAFGIIMWEIVTLGCTPYPNLSGREVVRNIPHGTRPEIPHACRPELAELMQRTWRKDPRHRPTFTEARIELGQYLRLWETDENDCTSDYLDVSGFSEDVEHGMVYLNRRISEFECEI